MNEQQPQGEPGMERVYRAKENVFFYFVVDIWMVVEKTNSKSKHLI